MVLTRVEINEESGRKVGNPMTLWDKTKIGLQVKKRPGDFPGGMNEGMKHRTQGDNAPSIEFDSLPQRAK